MNMEEIRMITGAYRVSGRILNRTAYQGIT
jgi:hypothetical protein